MTSSNVRSPDVAFTLKERLPDGKPSKGFENLAPDLAVEILSPSDDITDLPRKVNEHFSSGAQQVWLLEPKRVTVYLSLSSSRRYESEDEMEGGALLPAFRCRVSELFDID